MKELAGVDVGELDYGCMGNGGERSRVGRLATCWADGYGLGGDRVHGIVSVADWR